jgi:hypothetical protein
MSDHKRLRQALFVLASELVQSIQSTWSGDWSSTRPEIGSHYSYQDIEELPSFPRVSEELASSGLIDHKYQNHSGSKPIGAFLEFCVSILPHPDLLEKAFNFWWDSFLKFLISEEVPVVLLVGLSNFEAAKQVYRLDDEITVKFFGTKSIQSELDQLVSVPVYSRSQMRQHPLHLVPGAIRVDFSRPADIDTLEYGHYSHDCINRMLPLQNALALSVYGRLIIGPWFPILNPEFPVDGVQAIGAPESRQRFNEPIFLLDDAAWERFCNLYPTLHRFQIEEEQVVEANSAVRRRFLSAISRFVGTIDQGYSESVIVDLVILMESLVTPERQGGRMQLALAVSNLLATDAEEAREVFENLSDMYLLRNLAVHGEPSTQAEWNTHIQQIATNAGVSSMDLDRGVRAYAFEVMRDYARRAIAAMLNIFQATGRGPSGALARQLHRLHLDPDLKAQIQMDAKIFPISQRPAYKGS